LISQIPLVELDKALARLPGHRANASRVDSAGIKNADANAREAALPQIREAASQIE
jgi:hypothetical protein